MAFYDTPERQAINLSEDNARLRSELARAQAALGDAQADLRAVKCGHATPKEARLERELAKAQAECVALAAANHELFGELRRHVEECECKLTPHFSSTAANALRALLGPTVELLEGMLEYQKRYRQPHVEDIRKELTRLRAAREGGK